MPDRLRRGRHLSSFRFGFRTVRVHEHGNCSCLRHDLTKQLQSLRPQYAGEKDYPRSVAARQSGKERAEKTPFSSLSPCRVSYNQGQRTANYVRSFVVASTDLIAAIRSAVGIATTVGRIAVAAETVAKSAMLMAAMETTEVSGHVATTEAAAEMTAAETATMAPPTTAPASECGS